MYWNQKSPLLWDCHSVLKSKTWTTVYYAMVVLPATKIWNNTPSPSTDKKSTGCSTLYVPSSAKDMPSSTHSLCSPSLPLHPLYFCHCTSHIIKQYTILRTISLTLTRSRPGTLYTFPSTALTTSNRPEFGSSGRLFGGIWWGGTRESLSFYSYPQNTLISLMQVKQRFLFK